ncbi:MAG: 16S rRNA (adenine(1518)-N(6)/adenine(1519)-N(6))-dimethyltransferase RsmA [Dehalococcoidia bacterium]
MTPPRAGGQRAVEPRRPTGRSGGSSRQGSSRPAKAKRSPSLVTPPEVLRRLGVSPRKALGQHFLLDTFILGDLADACLLGPEDTVLEIGAGPGGLTEELAKRAGHVVAVELDEELASLSRRRLAEAGNVEIINADCLDYTPEELLEEAGAAAPYIATGNLPYYITQPVIRRLLEADPAPDRIVVLVQREVARRMVGGPGHESLLSMSIKCYGTPEPLFDVPASAFWPPPKVESAAVRIVRLPEGEAGTGLPHERIPRLFNLLRAGFSEPRKQLHNVLAGAFGIPDRAMLELLGTAAIDPAARAQHLDLADWRRLFDAIEATHPKLLDA